jgi:hypothetical protein
MTKLTKFLPQANLILAIAERIANKHPNVKGACELIAKDLTKELRSRGVNAKHVVGNFTLDEPDAEQYMECDCWDGQDEYEVNHDWVEVEGKILDVSAKQFRKSVTEYIPNIVHIGYSDPLHKRYKFLNYYGDDKES